MRDDGYRYDSAATTSAWSEIVAFFERVFAV
jgi:carboxymethylenebutenolidase